MARKFGWHSGILYAQEARIRGNLLIQDNLIFGDVSFGVLRVKGRMVTGTAAGTAIDIDASYAYGQGHELRWTISSWSGTGNTFDGQYVRAQSDTENASGNIRGMQIYGVGNNVNTLSILGILAYAYVKGSGAKTVGAMYAIQPELSWDATANTCTLSTEAICVRAKITGGKVDDYTKIHGVQVRAGDMNAASPTYGNAFWLLDDADMTGTVSWTIGVNLEADCTTGISFGGTVTTGIDFTSTTLALDSSRTNSAIAIGDRLGAKTITMAAATNHLDPVQINLLIDGVDPTAGSTINGIYQLISGDPDTNMPGIRLKCSDWNIVVKRNIQDAYVYQGEIDYTTNSVTVGGESAVMSLNMNCASTVTGNVRGLIVNMHGAGLANSSSIGIEVRTDGGSATLDEGIRIWSVGANTITAGLLFTGTITYFADMDGCSGANGTITSDGGSAASTFKARIKVKTDDGTDAWINCYSTSNE